ncbi:hypothetical protein FQN52_007302 [Onygenales sp. PD_12]|nr:hypothetical protein FQN52_007302 [Onygenales sp. PD_12]
MILYHLYSLQELDITRSSYNIEDWSQVRFKKHLEFDYYDNFTDLIDDKGISFYWDEAAATWDHSLKTRSSKSRIL